MVPSRADRRFDHVVYKSQAVPPIKAYALPQELGSFCSCCCDTLLVGVRPLLLVFGVVFILGSVSPATLSAGVLVFLLSC